MTSPEDICNEIKRRFTPSKAYRAQRWIAQHAVIEDMYEPVRIVAGLDVAYRRSEEGSIGYGVVAALSYPSMKLVDCEVFINKVCVPYIPGLLAFREMAVLAPALTRLSSRIKPDLLVVDGHGIAHPRRAGIATHVGVVFDIPSIGVAKKRLYGREVTYPDGTYLVDENGNKIAAIITRSGKSKIYVSPGHRLSVKTSSALIRSMLRRGRLPEPTRVADRISKEIRTSLTPRSLPLHRRCGDSSFYSRFS
ncbi:MAG: endonuclease V [Desulfurococcales archaeon]|nr:endonuclease V [Desulfurococcales archaeon]